MKGNSKLVRITTVPISLMGLLRGQSRFMNNHFEVIGVSSAGTELEKVKENEGIEVVSINMTRTISPFKDLVSLWKMFLFFKKEKPNIVHTHTPKAGTIGMIAAKLAGVPIRLHTVAGMPLLEQKGFKRRILDQVEKLTYSCANFVYPNSYGLRDIIVKNELCEPQKLKVIGNGSSNGIDVNRFSIINTPDDDLRNLRVSLNISEKDFVYLFVGRLVSDKGLNELISAFKEIERSNSGVKLLLVGQEESGLDPLLPKTLEEIRNNRNIITVGFQADVRPYFAISNVFTFPSYREGFPNVVMQAGSMGLSSIVSDINGCNEIIINNKNGIIVPVKNCERLKESMLLVYNDRTTLDLMASNSRELIQTRYDQSTLWNALLREYETLENLNRKQ